MRQPTATERLFRLAGGPDASAEDVKAAARSHPDVWVAALREMADAAVSKSRRVRHVDLTGFGGTRAGPLTDVRLDTDDEPQTAADAVRAGRSAGEAIRYRRRGRS